MTSEAEIEEQPRAPRVSVVIVSLNRREELLELLTALGNEHQVIVVDNGSTDGAQHLDEQFPHVRFSKLPKNFGLTKALNIGVRAAGGEYILLLHDDVRIGGSEATRLAEYLESHSDAGAACPLLRRPDGSAAPQTGPILSPDRPVFEWSPADPSGSETAVECAIGAAVMLRASFLRALRQIDERYGTFGNTAELCAQVRRANRKTVIVTGVEAVHYELESSVKNSLLDGDRIAGTAAFLGKHHGFMAGLTYRIKAGLGALFTFRFKALAGALAGAKIDGTG